MFIYVYMNMYIYLFHYRPWEETLEELLLFLLCYSRA